MRFPKIPIMERAFRLFEYLGFREGKDGQLLKYYFEGENCPRRFNDIVYVPPKDSIPVKDPFRFSTCNNGLVPDCTVNDGAEEILQDAFGYFKYRLKNNFEKGFQELLRRDNLSTREYLRQVLDYDFHSIQYLETMNSATGQYDQAFSESVMDSFDFDYPSDKPVEWFCVKGGTSEVIKEMVQKLNTKPSLKHRVMSIKWKQTPSDRNAFEDKRSMEVKVANEKRKPYKEETKNFSALFNTTSLACMQRMDLRDAGFGRAQLDAMRNLHYDDSTKVAIEFDAPWWKTKCNIKGGYASTDLPIRTCVYPSYNLEAKGKAVLLCSYTWGQDAQRMGSLVEDNSPMDTSTEKYDQLKELLVHNLALLHQNSASYKEMHDTISKAYLRHHAYNWYKDPNTAGAFALFGPGQFANYYPKLIEPAANGHLYLAGEASSAHHAWIVGSLDSAYRALVLYLRTLQFSLPEICGSLEALDKEWGELREIQSDALDWLAILSKMDLPTADA
ncbi:hypothetical protein CNMCM7691_005747 [Aspergillus felis]|uniref:Amine oxidase domain-containing protein n=1 Tax=Aspergillus felis TaxID=1287682 RepID=A0A8H6V704_9EURO|nr:hypothetical protein CNMCM7691_005747 [Aspergillus felis]